jgi:hypothetical protein
MGLDPVPVDDEGLNALHHRRRRREVAVLEDSAVADPAPDLRWTKPPSDALRDACHDTHRDVPALR